tara:strand:- start:972 stop:1892 length:921 start_codon:yes stop_codon:yes gene_type:complete
MDSTLTVTGNTTLSGNLTFDSVSLTAIQTSGESFVDNDTSLMTSAAIDDRINTAVTAEDLDLTSDSGTIDIDLNSETLTIAGGNALSTSATGTTVTIDHDDTSSQATVNNSGSTFIQDVTLDTYGHVTGLTSVTSPAATAESNGIASFPESDFTVAEGGAVTPAAVKTTASSQKYSVTGNTDGTFQGDVVYFGGTTSMTTGAIYHYKSDGTWELADADAVANCDGLLAVALGAASNTNGMLLRGMVTLDHDPGAVGDVLFLSTTAGDCSATAPSGTGDIIRVIGYCLDASNGQIWFNPDGTYVEVA